MKIFTRLFTVILLISILVGCSNGVGKAPIKEKTLKWVMLGPGVQQDSQKVWDEFNLKLQEFMPGVKVNFEIIPASDYAEKYNLLTSARENVDIIWVGWMIKYASEARNGALAEMDELLEKTAPDLKNEFPDWVWDLARVDGKIYSVPNYQMFNSLMLGIRTQKELSDKYWDVKKAQEVFLKNKTFTEESYNEIEKYLKNLKDNGKTQLGISSYFPVFLKGYEEFLVPYCIKKDDNTFKVQNKWLIPETELYFNKFASWFEKGYIRKDILSAQNPRQEEGKKDGYTVWMHGVLKDEAERQSKTYGFPVEVVPMDDEIYIGATANSSSNAIAEVSKNKEDAMKLLALLNTKKGQALYNLLVYGIEGVHYNKKGDKSIEHLIAKPGNPVANDKYGLTKWAVGNTYYAYETQADTKGWNDYVKNEINEKAIISKIISFRPNTDKVRTEVAQVDAVLKEYTKQLMSGAMPNQKQIYEEFKAKLEGAGNQKIIDELQKQINEYINKNK